MSINKRIKRRIELLTLTGVIALMAGCASTGAPSLAQSEAPPVNTTQLMSQYEQDPENVDVAVGLAKQFRKAKRYDDAIAILMRTSVTSPDDGALNGELGKILIERGAFPEALSFLSKAAAKRTTDWTIYSAAGVAYDQMGDHASAQDSYKTALLHAPRQPTVLNNLGLSYAMAGDLKKAEAALRQAAATNGSSQRVRLNLALTVGLQGRFEEAERLASADLPAEMARKNVSYLRELLHQPARWQEMKSLGDAEASDAMVQPLDAALDVPSVIITPVQETANP